MKRRNLYGGLVVVLGFICAPAQASDAGRGLTVLEAQGCLGCHTVREEGAGHEILEPAPDLAGRLVGKYTPTSLASLVWNHSPEMLMEAEVGIGKAPNASEEDWADLFAYLYSLQIDDIDGANTRRGRELLDEKNCTMCHALQGSSEGPAIADWQARDAAHFAYQLWAHTPAMAQEIAAHRETWKRLSGRDLNDILAVAQTVQNDVPDRTFRLPPPEEGAELFSDNCASCHRGARSLASELMNTSWMDIVAAMWNHAPDMPIGTAALPIPSEEDFARILSYVWELQYQGPQGIVSRGQQVFNRKGCISCHSNAQGQAVNPQGTRKLTPYGMAALGWGAARHMHETISDEGKGWPTLSTSEMRDLIAYINTLPAQ